MEGLTHLRHISLISPEVQKQDDYYRNVWGLDPVYQDDNSVYYRGMSSEHHILSLHHGDKKGIHHIAFGMVDKKAVDNAYEKLLELEVPIVSSPRYLDEAGGGYGLRFIDPDGRCIELSCWVEIHTTEWNNKQVDPLKLNHVVLNTPDIDRAVDFYTDILGFKVSDWSEHQMAFLRCNKRHHSISFNQASYASVNHIAYEVDGIDELMRGLTKVTKSDNQILWGPGRHGPGNNVFCYFKDPVGFVIEYTCYLITIEDESEWETLVWKRVPHLMDRWGTAGPPPPGAREAMAGEPDEGWAVNLAK